MKHYKQIIINLLVEDDCEDQKIEEFVETKVNTELPEIKEITTRVNL